MCACCIVWQCRFVDCLISIISVCSGIIVTEHNPAWLLAQLSSFPEWCLTTQKCALAPVQTIISFSPSLSESLHVFLSGCGWILWFVHILCYPRFLFGPVSYIFIPHNIGKPRGRPCHFGKTYYISWSQHINVVSYNVVFSSATATLYDYGWSCLFMLYTCMVFSFLGPN